MTKPIHAKPNIYAYYFEKCKEIAKGFGYNLVVHGSLSRDLDLIAIPWVDDPKDELEMINALSNYMNGWTSEHKSIFLHNILPGGRKSRYSTEPWWLREHRHWPAREAGVFGRPTILH